MPKVKQDLLTRIELILLDMEGSVRAGLWRPSKWSKKILREVKKEYEQANKAN